MTPGQRTRLRTTAATVLTAMLLTSVTAGALHHLGHLKGLLIALVAALSVLIAVLTLAAAFAPAPATRTAARHTLDLLLRLVPWYTPRERP